MDYAVFVAVVAGAMLLVGAATWLLVRPVFRRTPLAVLGVVAIALYLILGVVYTLEGRFVWQGAGHYAIAIGWLLVLWMNQRQART